VTSRLVGPVLIYSGNRWEDLDAVLAYQTGSLRVRTCYSFPLQLELFVSSFSYGTSSLLKHEQLGLLIVCFPFQRGIN
jgi:hypothetical protein